MVETIEIKWKSYLDYSSLSRNAGQRCFSVLYVLHVSTVGGLVIPRILGEGINTALSYGSRTTIVILAGITIGTTILRSAGRFGDTYITQLVSQQASYDIRNALYDHLHRSGFFIL